MSLDADYKISPTVEHPPLVDNQIVLMCRSCRRDPPNIVENFRDGDLVCGDCGLVFPGRIIDTRSEWRTFDGEDGDDPSRVGQADNPFLDGTQLDTIISRRDGGSGVSRALAKAHGKASANKGERELVSAYKDITAMCDHARLSKAVSDTAKQVYKMSHDNNLFPNLREREIVVAACIFTGCRYAKVPRTFKEICALTRVSKRELGRCYKVLVQHLGMHLDGLSPEMLMMRFCTKLQLPPSVARAAAAVAVRARDLGVADGRSPVSIAAACIFFCAPLFGKPKNPRDIGVVTGVSEATIRGAYKQLYVKKDELVDAASGVDQGQGTALDGGVLSAHGGVESLPAP